MKVDKKVIAERKRKYGNSFPCMAKKWNEYLSSKLGVSEAFKVSEKDVAEVMALFKECRIEFMLKKGVPMEDLGDSFVDKANYEWIAENYEEYENI